MSLQSSTFMNISCRESSLPSGLYCILLYPYSFILTTYAIINILVLLPVCILVLYQGLQQRRRHRSSSAITASHSDSYTYHLATIEIIYVIGCILCWGGSYTENCQMLLVWFYLFIFTWYGETCFQTLTCVEHYMAVVHPIAYRSLNKEKGIRIKQFSISCSLLFSFVGACLVKVQEIASIALLCQVIISLIITFCCISVLCALIRPGPGEQSRRRARVDQSKNRAFYIIVAILGVLSLRNAWNLTWGVLYMMVKSEINECLIIGGDVWFTIPSSLVLPLLFLQKVQSFACSKTNVK